jgi:thiamine transport system permease protein
MDRGVEPDRASLIRRAAIAAVPVVFLGYLFVYPMARILALAFGEQDGLAGFADVLASPRLRGSVWFTLWQASLSTALTLLAAAPITWAIARFRFPGRSLVKGLVVVPFVLPTVVVGTAFVALGVSGTLWAILAAHVFFNVAVVVRTVGGMWSRIDPTLLESARTLGASPARAFREVTLPLLRPALLAASSLVFLFTFTSFGVVLILGGQRYRTIEVEIYQQAVTFLDLPTAGALAVLQLAGVSVALALYSRHQERTSVRLRLVAEDAALRSPAGAERWWVAVAVIGTGLLLATPIVALVARSFAGGGAGWQYLVQPGPLAVTPVDAVANSLGFALLATLIALGVGLAAALVVAGGWGRLSSWFDVVLMLPLGTSAVTIGFGLLIALDQPIDLRASLLLVPLAHALVAVPFVVRTTVPLLRSIRQDLRDAAAVLGASPRRVFREVDLPIIARAAAVGAGFAAAVSLGEFGATAFLARPATTTIPFLVYRLLSRPGAVTYSAAMAMAVVLAIATAGLVLAIDRLRAGELGRF